MSFAKIRPEMKMNYSSSAFLERKELLTALVKALDELPLVDRQLVALYYGGGLTKGEIAQKMSTTRSAISMRIKRSHARLCAHLSQAGYPAMDPMLNAAALNEAICTGSPVPPGLYERVLEQVERHRSRLASIRASRRAKFLERVSLVAQVVIAGLAAALAFTAIWTWWEI